MADNTELNPGTGGDIIASDDVSGVKYQVVKLAVGADGAASLVANANPIPISDAGGNISIDDGGNTITVDGTVAVTNAGTFATQVDGAALTALQLIDNIVAVEDAVAGSGYSGVPFLAVRQDSYSDLAADGDFISPTIDADGGLRVSIVAGAGSGGTAVADDADFTDGTTSLTPIGGVYESTPSSVTDGDIGMAGITSTRALRVAIDSGGVAGRAEDSAHSSGHEGIVMLAVRRDSAAVGSDTDGDYSTINVDANGNLRTTATLSGVTDDGAYTAGSGTGYPIFGFATGDSVDSGDVGAIAMTTARAMHVAVQNTVTVGSHAVTNAGTVAVQVDGSALTALQLIDNSAVADDAAFTPGTTGVTMAGFTADESSTDSVDEGDGGAARMTLDRKQIVTPYIHAAAGGHTPYKNLDCDESEDQIKGSAGKLFWIHVVNLANAKRYLKIYNDTAANVSVGTTVPDLTFPIPTMGDTNGAGFTLHFGDAGIQFTAAITVAATTGFADNDTGAPGANEVILNAGYQ
jgi:hypothetical protein